MAYLLVMNNAPTYATNDKKNYLIAYAVISIIVFTELYFLPSLITPYSYANKVHRFIGSFESVMTAFTLFFLISGILILRDKRTVARDNLAWRYSQEGKDLDSATEYAKRANTLVPGNPLFLDTLAEVQLKAGDTNAARKTLQEAISFEKDTERAKKMKEKLNNIQGN